MKDILIIGAMFFIRIGIPILMLFLVGWAYKHYEDKKKEEK